MKFHGYDFWHWNWMEDEYRHGKPRTEKEFKETLRKAAAEGKPWMEARQYSEWARAQRKDTLMSLRISSTDVMKLKALARMKGAKVRTYMVDILKREIRSEEERLATAKKKRLARHGRTDE